MNASIRAIAVGLVLTWLVACASTTPRTSAWISSSQFDRRDYAFKKVAVLPPTFPGPQDKFKKFPSKTVQDALVTQLQVLDMTRITAVNDRNGDGIEFPATPERLRTFGAEHGYDAVVGTTVVKFNVRRHSRGWSFTGNTTFVAVQRPERRWTIARTWTFPGDAPYASEKALNEVFRTDLLDVSRALVRGRTSTLLGRGTVVVDLGPILNLDVADSSQHDIEPFLRAVFNRPYQQVFSTTAPQVQVDVQGIDDVGITNLTVDAGAFHEEVVGPQAKLSENPIYIAQSLIVPLSSGPNSIRLTSVNSHQQKAVRELLIQRKDDNSKQGQVEVLLIAAEQYKSSGLRSNQFDSDARMRIAELAAENGATNESGVHVITLSGPDATRRHILKTIVEEWAQPAAGARRVVAFIGRAELVNGRPYLLTYDAEPDDVGVASISVDELASFDKYGAVEFDLDLCTENLAPDAVSAAVVAAGNDRFRLYEAAAPSEDAGNFRVAVNPGCNSNEIGRSALSY